MDDGFEIEVKGLAETAAALREIPLKFAKSIMRDALRAGGEVIRAAAEASAAYRSNTPEHLREDIICRVYVTEDLRGKAVIGPGYHSEGEDDLTRLSDPGVYGLFVELGHRAPGKSKAKQKKSPGLLTKAEWGSGSTPAHPWLRPAFEATEELALAEFVTVANVGLEAVARSYEMGLVKD